MRAGSTESRPTRSALRRLQPAPEHFGHAPRLSDAAAGGVGLPRVEHFADCAQAVLAHAFGKTFEELPSVGIFARMHFEPRVDERPDEPGPDRTLVIRSIARTQIA